MDVVVAGGTGFIGQRLVNALISRGDAVTVITRDPAKARVPAGVKTVGWGTDELGPRVTACDALVNLAGEGVADRRWSEARLAELRESRLVPTSKLAALLAASPRPGKIWVSASAVGIYGMRKDDEVLDEQGPHGDDVLAQLCESWEAATEPARAAGARVALARFGIVLGVGGGALARMVPAFKAFAGGPLGDGGQWMSWVHAQDVVRSILFAIDTPTFDGAFNVSAPKPVTMERFAKALAQALHRPCAFRVPAFALRAALGEGLAEALLTGQRVVPARLERAGFTFEYGEIDAALAEIVAAHRGACAM